MRSVVFAISLSEFAPLAAPTYQKFTKHGPLGHLAGLFLFPGWASGFFFCLLLAGISAAPFLINRPTHIGSDHFTYGLACLAGLLFPAVIIHIFRIHGPQRVSSYILILIASIVLSLVLAGITESLSNTDLLWFFCWIPPVLMFFEATNHHSGEALIPSWVVCTAYIGILLFLAAQAYRKSISEIRTHSTRDETPSPRK
jgi:hypothetical protein